MGTQGRLFVLELNEFNRELLLQGADELGLANIKKLLSLKEAATATKDTYESNWLEPWVQWVSVHTGRTSEQHGVKHLGDVPDLAMPQIWEALSERGISSGVWGALNASRGRAENCRVFLPDPWTFSEQAYPRSLNSFLDFPRYIAKNRVSFSVMTLITVMARYVSNFLEPRMFLELLKGLPAFLAVAVRYPTSAFGGFCLAEYLSSLFFLRMWKRGDFECAFLFLNSVAHVQHYYWKKNEPVAHNVPISYCLKLVDKLLSRVYASLEKEDHLLVVNALSQMNTNHEKDWYLYRPIDQEAFLAAAGVKFERVEALMSYDAIAFFSSVSAREAAEKTLGALSINGQPLFLTEQYKTDPLRLFYRVDFFDDIPGSTEFQLGGKSVRFDSIFQRIVKRTGRHVPRGTVFSSFDVPETIHNHEVFGLVSGFFEARG